MEVVIIKSILAIIVFIICILRNISGKGSSSHGHNSLDIDLGDFFNDLDDFFDSSYDDGDYGDSDGGDFWD